MIAHYENIMKKHRWDLAYATVLLYPQKHGHTHTHTHIYIIHHTVIVIVMINISCGLMLVRDDF